MSPKQLGEKKILVTGAASGMGRACAAFFRERGASVIVADIDFDGAKSTADEVGGEAFHVDLADPAAISGLAESVAAACGPVNGLLNCAGIMPNAIMPPDAISSTEWDRYFDVNVRGTFLLSVAFGSQMAKRGSGSIVNIASTTGLRSTPHHAYGASKASVVQISRNLAAQWARSNVRVNSISPGYVRTDGLMKNIEGGFRDADRITSSAAMGRMVEPNELAGAAAFLLCDDASAVTGIDLPVDAGWLINGSWVFYGGVPSAMA